MMHLGSRRQMRVRGEPLRFYLSYCPSPIMLKSVFDLNSYLEEKRRLIDATLDAELPGEDVLPSLLHKAMRYSVLSAGKRLRSILCLSAADTVGGSLEDALFPALSVELLHTYTLIHDDLPCMDDDHFRRGKPACHIAFGEANAILAGDALQALAFEWMARARVPSKYSPNQLVVELAQAAGSQGVVGGQVEDLADQDGELRPDRIEYIHLHKTADLFCAAVRIGSIVANSGEAELGMLTEYSVNVGLAFQIVDDLLDEKKENEQTCLSVYSPEDARERAEALVDKALSAIEKIDRSRTEPLVAIARFVIERTS